MYIFFIILCNAFIACSWRYFLVARIDPLRANITPIYLYFLIISISSLLIENFKVFDILPLEKISAFVLLTFNFSFHSRQYSEHVFRSNCKSSLDSAIKWYRLHTIIWTILDKLTTHFQYVLTDASALAFSWYSCKSLKFRGESSGDR